MNNIKIDCIIVDDEISSQNVLKNFISKTDVINLKQVCNNASEAFIYLQLHPAIQLIFLDINMPNQSGIDFIKSLQHPPKVIFTTAYPQYAVEGFELNATDYLLKPFSYERFLTAIGKVINTADHRLQNKDFTVLKENKKLFKIKYEDILFVEAFGDYVKVITSQKTVTTHSTFKKFIKTLPAHFLRVHKSFSVNLNKLEQISGNRIFIEKHQIPIGLTYKDSVLKKLQH
jgi:DNA-binding LytR/AlgR family response regulator